jgi:prepilin-type N-terminal cleavage/methylation domain-containing protein
MSDQQGIYGMNETNHRGSPTRPAGARAFTLVELLIALSILLIFGVMAVAALTYGTQLWRAAHRRSYAFDVATFVFQQLEDDLGAARSQFWAREEDAYDTRVKFWVDHDGEFGGDWQTEGGRQRLRFVRGIPDATVNPRLRQAGNGEPEPDDPDGSTDEEYYNLKDDDSDGSTDEDLMALEGMCEVAYVMGLDESRDSLFRAVLAPIGDDSRSQGHESYTFFDQDLTDGDIFDDADRITNKSVRLADNILHFEVRLWTQFTTSWDLWDADGDRMDFATWQSSYEPEECPPIFTWDSDRLVDGEPEFLLDPGRSGSRRKPEDHDGDGTPNENDEDYVRDNVFPRSVMVILVVDPAGEYPNPRTLRLRNPLAVGADQIVVNGELPAYNRAWPYIRINDEWIRFESFEPDDQGGTFIVDERAVRGTSENGHDAGDEVRFGITFSRVFHNPAARPDPDWGQ